MIKKNSLIMALLSLVVLPPSSSMAEDEMPVQLQSTIVGDKEQPTVSYFIPWQGMGSPDKLFRNIEGKHDDSLRPVDRDVMLRTMRMYNEMNLEAPNN